MVAEVEETSLSYFCVLWIFGAKAQVRIEVVHVLLR